MAHDPHAGHYHPQPNSGDNLPPDSDPAQQSLVGALQAGFNILRLLMVVLVLLYLFSGVFQVGPGQQGLVARFGELRETRNEDDEVTSVFDEGWHWKLPDPFDEEYIVTGEVQNLVVTTFLFNHPKAAFTKDLAEIVSMSRSLTPGVDGMMITGDRNISHGRWEVQYQINSAALFVKNVGQSTEDLEPLLQRLTESAVVREVAGRTVEQVTRTGLDVVREGVKRRLQESLDELETGVQINQVVAYTIEPGAVRDAFMKVIRAEQERQSVQDKARAQATQILSEAAGQMYDEILALIEEYGELQLTGADKETLDAHMDRIDEKLDEARERGAGRVAVILAEAVADADRINESLRREYEEYAKYAEQLRTQPRITLLNLWVEMRRKILGTRENEIFFVPKGSDELEILINRDPQRRIELEEQRVLERQHGLIQGQ